MAWTADNLLVLLVFAAVILAIAFDLIDMVVAALLGVSVLIVCGEFDARDTLSIFATSNGAVALLFGGMVVARVLVPTGLFEQLGARYLHWTKGSGRRFLLGIVALVVPLCAVLPNATTVVLLAPIIVRVARALEVELAGPLILMAVLSNSAGLLTLVGDPGTFLVASSIGVGFTAFLQRVSPGGLLALIAALGLVPVLFADVWSVRRTPPAPAPLPPIDRPWFCVAALAVLAAMVVLFVFGDVLPAPVVPPAAAIVAASLGLVAIYGWHIEAVDRVLRDVDWKTLVFLICMFCLVQAVSKTGVLNLLSDAAYTLFGTRLLPVALGLLAGIGALSSVLANIPVMAGMLLLVKAYLVTAEAVPEEALGVAFGAWPSATFPVFAALMFGGTLGGNATLIGASANVVCAGVCASHGERLTFGRFARRAAPIALAQLAVSAAYVCGLYVLM